PRSTRYPRIGEEGSGTASKKIRVLATTRNWGRRTETIGGRQAPSHRSCPRLPHLEQQHVCDGIQFTFIHQVGCSWPQGQAHVEDDGAHDDGRDAKDSLLAHATGDRATTSIVAT